MNQGQDNRYTMSPLNLNSKKGAVHKSNKFKNIIIVFGMGLSLLIVSSTTRGVISAEEKITSEIREFNKCEKMNETSIENKVANDNQNNKSHHNFIASYLLHESGYERKNKKSKEHGKLLGNIIKFHKFIISHTFNPI